MLSLPNSWEEYVSITVSVLKFINFVIRVCIEFEVCLNVSIVHKPSYVFSLILAKFMSPVTLKVPEIRYLLE